MSTLRTQFIDFVEFASQRIEHGIEPVSMEELVRLWRDQREHTETVEDIREGIKDHSSGKGEPLQKSFDDIRRQLGLTR